MERFVGIDVGAETIKVAEVAREPEGLRLVRHAVVMHGKGPGPALRELLAVWDWDTVSSAVTTGRLSRQLALRRIPTKQALLRGLRLLHGPEPLTVVSIGSRGVAVLEARERGAAWRENSRCAQGTGNFLRQLVERFGLSVEEAASLAEGVPDAAPLSGRCPVILKTDMTHLANKGERRERILAGLLDAIAESAEVLVKPRRSPRRVLLVGGVTRARRVREHFRRFLERNGMELVDADPEHALVLEAAGCAVEAAREHAGATPLERLVRPAERAEIETVAPLSSALGRVRRMPRPPPAPPAAEVVLGIDVGSTGSKAVALDAERGEPVWEGYVRTSGNPVGAAQALVRELLAHPASAARVRCVGVTGSGREIVGSLLATCYGAKAVFVLNEIAAHARGATHHDPRVDTIFEIGGQDAKYIRLAGGRVVDAAMNEACSAGTGSFIEEQGRRFAGLADVAALGATAVGADRSAALGQHCSVFMAEVIDEAIAAAVPRERIVAGLYESVISNYLNRVKGSRSVGDVVFCQGMPFASDALAAAVARQTGADVIVPPSPGTTGALGIALLAREAAQGEEPAPLELRSFLAAAVEAKDTFVCKSTSGCGGGGNKCRIDRLTTRVEGDRKRFTWGGSCSLYDQGTRRRKLPDGAPDPFRERAELAAAVAAPLAERRGGRSVAIADAFQLKGMFPFFATFLHRLGLDLDVVAAADRGALKRGAEAANVPWCAPMQQYHGLVGALAERGTDFVFAPMVRDIRRVGTERAAQLCPIVQGSSDVVRWDLGAALEGRMLAPVIDVGPGPLDSRALRESCRRLAALVGAGAGGFEAAFARAREAQLAFDDRLLEIGRAALDAAARAGALPVVVLGRTYTIHDDVLNSNVPAILRDQGAIAIPTDCYPVADDAPLFENMYWGHGQRILRAAWQVRRAPGVYALFASNYSCGPDSFTSHFIQDLMDGKPFSVIETDGHAGDAGTRTRVEAFLHCVREHLAAGERARPRAPERLTVRSATLHDVRDAGEQVLVPAMGDGGAVVAAALRGCGLRAEALPEPGADALRIGRRHTSGKECLPMTLTLGSLLERLERARPDERFAFFMPGTDGPCRFGVYKELHQLVLERLGYRSRVRIWSPPFGDYFQGVPPGLGAIVLAAVTALDVLRDALLDVRPGEPRAGAAEAIHRDALARIVERVEAAARGSLSLSRVLREAATGSLWGLPAIVRDTAAELFHARGAHELPRVLVVGEIYVRNVPSSNGFAVEALERRGLRARIAPITEFLHYSEHIGAKHRGRTSVADLVDRFVRWRVESACRGAAAATLGGGAPAGVRQVVRAAAPWVNEALEGETVLTVGAAVHAALGGEIDGILSLGPLECMPNKLAETHLAHVGEKLGIPTLTLSLNGDPVDPEPLDGFALEVKERFRARRPPPPAAPVADPSAAPAGAWPETP